jgi:drug/metabolite transporter (DMT)-like permease
MRRKSGQGRWGAVPWAGILAALGVAVCIAVYSTIDAAAVQIMDPVSYNVLILALMALFMTPLIFWQYGASKVWQTGRKEWKKFSLVGAFTVLTYMLVLIAYSQGHVSYAGALREVSVVFGAIMGWRFLGEKMGAVRIAGAVVIAAGIVIIASA